MDYLITAIGHIDETRRPRYIDEGREPKIEFPKKIYDLHFIRTDGSDQMLVDEVNKKSAQYVRNNGMSVRFDPFGSEDMTKVTSDRMWVPMHMITHITVLFAPIVAEVPGFDVSGQLVNPSGKPIVKQ